MNEEIEYIFIGGQGCIMVLFYIGNWEMCVQLVVVRGVVIIGVYQVLKNLEVDKVFQVLCQDFYKGGFLLKGYKIVWKIFVILKGGGIVVIMGDLWEIWGIKVFFFGWMVYVILIFVFFVCFCSVLIVFGWVVCKKGVIFWLEVEILCVLEI